jgi:hypothetical protein
MIQISLVSKLVLSIKCLNSNSLVIIAGNEATNAYGSNFLGNRLVMDVVLSNFFGTSAGYLATNAFNQILIGLCWFEATKCFNSNFIGSQAGNQANKC